MKNLFVCMVCVLMAGLGACNSTSQKETGSGADATCCVSQKENLVYVMNLERKVKPEHIAAFKESFEKCKVGTLQEPGCLDYAMYQSYTDSTRFFIAETWGNKGEHIKHMDTPHLKLHIEEIRGMGDPDFRGNNAEIYVCPMVNSK